MTLVTVLLGALVIGAVLGLLGGGGTVLTVPLLQALLGVPTPQAVAMSLPVVAVSAAAGAVVGLIRGAFRLRPALGVALTTSVGAYAGARFAQLLGAGVQTRLLAMTLIVAAVSMWMSSRREANRSVQARPAPARLGAAGLAVGVVTGLVGVGGGFLIVPALVSLGGYALAEAVPASLFVIATSATAAAIGYAGVPVPWGTVAVIALTAVAGVLIGGAAGRQVAPARLQRAFSLVLAAAAGYVFVHR